jgi:hypothetical protein
MREEGRGIVQERQKDTTANMCVSKISKKIHG